jgi:hypothetical protein
MLERVISGGQTGVDQAALYAAKDCGLATGGWMPKGYRTLTRDCPEFATMFNMKEHESFQYAPRTGQNVLESDATIRIAEDFSSAGEKCTKRYINLHKRPDMMIRTSYNKNLQVGGTSYYGLMIAEDYIYRLINFLKQHDVRTLNVAGNSEITCPGIYDATYLFLWKVFKELKNGK